MSNVDYIEGQTPSDSQEEAGAEVLTIVASAGAGERVDRFLAQQLPALMPGVSRARIQQWMSLGAVWCGERPLLPKTRLAGYETLYVQPLPREADSAFEPDDVELPIVYEDDSLIVIDKPAGLVTHPAAGNWRGTLLNGLLFHRPQSAALPRAGIVHRLDKDTSGLMVVGKTEAACTSLVAQLADRSMSRRYLAIVQGRPPAQGEIDLPIGRDPRHRTRMAVVAETAGRPAQTRFDRLACNVATSDVASAGQQPVASLVGCALRTGRTHQIRVHLACLGHPLFGDALYGGRTNEIVRQALHATALALSHPENQRRCEWRAAPPIDMQQLARQLALLDGDQATLESSQSVNEWLDRVVSDAAACPLPVPTKGARR